MGNRSLFGYQSENPAARNAYDLCILNDEKRRAESGKPTVYNVLTGRFQSYEEFYGKDSTEETEEDE